MVGQLSYICGVGRAIRVTYFATGTETPICEEGVDSKAGQSASLRQQCENLRLKLARAVRPGHEALIVIGGDFNWVTATADCVSLDTLENSGARDASEESRWKRVILGPHGFHELHQPNMTHCSAKARSRLDRLY